MEDGPFTPNSAFGSISDAAMDLDFMDELFFEGCWLETTEGLDLLQPGGSSSGALNDPPSHCVPSSVTNNGHLSINPHQRSDQEEPERLNIAGNPPQVYPQIEELFETQSENQKVNDTATFSGQSESFLLEGTEMGKRLWIAPRAKPGPSSPVKERLLQALGYLKECTGDRDVLIQIWVPVKREGRNVLTTNDQPYTLDPNSKSLAYYRNVSKGYHFAAEEDSKDSAGLPGRVYLGKLPEWTPDVRFFRSEEYPRIGYAHQYNVSGSLALPVFERGSGSCLGVIEIVTTSQKVNYRPELENVCKALEAFDLRSSQSFSPPNVKVCNESYKAALPDIVEVLTSVCKMHRLPLALTWAPCVQQGKGGCRHSDENYASCVSTVDSACFVADLDILDFHNACSEHHLFRGQGIVGRAFTTNKLCFATDITSFSKTEYPLSHHARMFGLRAAAAIPLRSIYTWSVDFVLEFFLPKDCQDIEEQKRMVNSLSVVIQQACQSLHLVLDKEIEEEVILPVRDMVVASDGRHSREETQKLVSSPSKEPFPEESSWIAHMMEAQKKGKGVSVSLEYHKEELKEEFKVTTDWDNTQHVISEFGKLQQNSGPKVRIEGGGNSSSFVDHHSLSSQKAVVKRRTKTEKTISLQVLRQYFAGSLKDAAKSIGVCPTTLKRICRQHGITRWPSRKIKKVGHSLRKLQLVIDSVQGAEGAIQIGSFYSSFPELSSPNPSGTGPFSSVNMSDHSKQLYTQPEGGLFSPGATSSKSPSSSCSQSSGSSICCSTGAKQQTTIMNASSSGGGSMGEDPGGMLKRARSDAELHVSNPEEPKPLARSLSHKSFGEHPSIEIHPPLPKSSGCHFKDGGACRVKATFGEEKIRFSLQPNWGFRELQQEIARRFSVDNISGVDIKYLDDDCEWVLLTCDADLEECIDIYKLSQGHTIKLSLHRASHPNRGSLIGSSGPS